MQMIALILCLFLSVSFSSSVQYEEMWGAWKTQYKKTYVGEEDSTRYSIFLQNFDKIQKFNSENSSLKLALNKFGDLSGEEFKKIYTGCGFTKSDVEKSNKRFLKVSTTTDLPEAVDWRESGVVTDPKDQGQCGSCWAFSATGALESYYALRIGSLVKFSEQQIVDCNGAPNLGCNGGFPHLALEYASQNGLQLEEDYPYTGKDGVCKFDANKAIQINIGYAFTPPNNKDALKASIAMAPTSVVVEADQIIFQFYNTGVVGAGCGPKVDHAVLAVGYTVVDGVEAFIVKNSWGADWGKNGYIYIATDSNLNAGMGACGILRQPLFAF